MKKLISIILAAVMLLGCMSFTAFAADINCETCGGQGSTTNPAAAKLLTKVKALVSDVESYYNTLLNMETDDINRNSVQSKLHTFYSNVDRYLEVYEESGMGRDSIWTSVYTNICEVLSTMWSSLNSVTYERNPGNIVPYIGDNLNTIKTNLATFEAGVEDLICPDCGGTGKITVPDPESDGSDEADTGIKVITEDNGSTPYDVEVGYTYVSGTDTAAKHFYVTLAFTLPTALEFDGGVKAYKWNPENGAYEADDANNVPGEADFDGTFSIVITNQSNVGINYTVEYTANTAAIFANEAVEADWVDKEGTVDTIAKGQEIDDTGITITNVDEATAENGDFNSAECTGTITVTGINEGKTPSTEAGSTDTLGTFKVTITEAEDLPETLTIAEIVAMSDIPLKSNETDAVYTTKWKVSPDAERGAYINDGENLAAYNIVGNGWVLSLDLTATKNEDGKYVAYKDSCFWQVRDDTGINYRYGNAFKWTFTIKNNKLISFNVERTNYGYVSSCPEEAQHINEIESYTITKQA